MRGYVESKEREHFNHPDNCGCEVEPTGPGFYAWLAQEEADLPHGGECDCDGCGEWYAKQEQE